MTGDLDTSAQPASPIPLDDLKRSLVLAEADEQSAPHIGLVGDTYTILLTGRDTAGRFCLIDMHIPPGGGPPPHRHDFEESFIMLEGEIELTFRGQKSTARAGAIAHIPANAPTSFGIRVTTRHVSYASARLRGRKSSSPQLASPSRPGQPLPQRWTRQARRRSERRPRCWRQSIGQKCLNMLEAKQGVLR